MFKIIFFFLTSVFLSIQLSSATDNQQALKTGQIIKQTKLHSRPDNNSVLGDVIKADSNINILSRHRAWYNISAESNLTGWVNMLNVRFTHSAKRDGDLGLGSLFSSVTNDNLPTVSTGVRGFEDADLKSAQANFQQVLLNKVS